MSDFIIIVTVDTIKALLESQPDFIVERIGKLYSVRELKYDGYCLIEIDGNTIRIEFKTWSKQFERRIRKCLKLITKKSEAK